MYKYCRWGRVEMIRKLLKQYRHLLTRQQIKTINGQDKAGDKEGALKGLQKILRKQGVIIEYNK